MDIVKGLEKINLNLENQNMFLKYYGIEVSAMNLKPISQVKEKVTRKKTEMNWDLKLDWEEQKDKSDKDILSSQRYKNSSKREVYRHSELGKQSPKSKS